MTETSEQIDLLAQALVAAQGEFESVAKTATNPFFKSKYADLPAVVSAAAPILKSHGLAITQLLGFIPEVNVDTLTTRLIHESGQWIESTMRLYLTKSDAQGQGSATTYARRYSYMAILGLVADEDDDGNKASGQTPEPKTTKRESPVKPVPTAAFPPSEAAMGKPNLRKLFAINGRDGNKVVPADDAARHAWAKAILGRDVTSFTELTAEDVAALESAAKDQAKQAPTTYGDDDNERPF